MTSRPARHRDEASLARRARILFFSVLGAVAVVIGAYVGVAYAVSGHGVVARNTSVDGVDISGMSVADAEKALASLSSSSSSPITATIDGAPFQVVPSDAGLGLDVKATVASATGFLWKPTDVFGRVFGKVQIPRILAVNDDALSSAVLSLAAEVDQPAVEPSVAYEGLTPVVRPGTTGKVLDKEAFAAALKSVLLGTSPQVNVDLVEDVPTVTDAAATDMAAGDAAVAIASAITVNASGALGSGTATLRPTEIARALQWVGRDGAMVAEFDVDVLREGVEGEFSAIERPGRDATFQIINDRPVVIPSLTGIGVSGEDLAKAVIGVLDSTANREVSVTLGVLEPKLTTAEAQALGVVEKISSFTQKYPYAEYRRINIGKAAEYINGSVVLPGGTYSHNDTLKERTEANGYVKGFVIGQGGIFKEELGGGVSASATATWTAAYFAGMEPVQVRAHSIWIPRYQAGLEATVSWGNFDMKFRNPEATGVFITARTTRSSLTIEMWGTKHYDEIRAISGPKVDIRSFQTINSRGPECLEQEGMIGFKITVDRVFIKDGVEVKREPNTTTYRPTPAVRCSGSHSSSTPTPSPTTSPTPQPSPTPTSTPVVPTPAPTTAVAVAPAPTSS